MLQLLPQPKVTKMVLILGAEQFSFHTVVSCDSLNAFSCGLNPPLLKKPQTQG